MPPGRLFAGDAVGFPLHQSYAMPTFTPHFWEAMRRLAVNH